MSELVAEFNDLVREAYDAQEAFDMWDAGFTFGGVFEPRRAVDLDTVVDEWDAANARLIDFVVCHSNALAAATRRAKTAKRVECEASQSGPAEQGNAQTQPQTSSAKD